VGVMRVMLCCVLFVTNLNLFGMQDDKKEQYSDSNSVVIPVSIQPKPVNLALQPGCCAICYEPIDDSIIRKALACCHEPEKIECSRCTAIYHRSCLESFFSISHSAEARAHQCPSRCGTVLIPLSFSQRLAQWCRKNLLMLDALFLGGLVAISLVSKYSTPSMYVCLGLSIIFLIAACRGFAVFLNDALALPAGQQDDVFLAEAKRLCAVSSIGMMAIIGGVLFRYLVLD
jgi:hypothetical protein